MSETLAMRMIGRVYVSSPKPYLREPALQGGPLQVWWLRLTIFRHQPPYVRMLDQYEVYLSTVLVVPGSVVLPVRAATDCWPHMTCVPYPHWAWLDNSFYKGFALNYPQELADEVHTG
jgi:hypothetical protein